MYIKSTIIRENQLLGSIFINTISGKTSPCIVSFLYLVSELDFYRHGFRKSVSVYSSINLLCSASISLTNDLKNVDKRALLIMHTLDYSVAKWQNQTMMPAPKAHGVAFLLVYPGEGHKGASIYEF